MSVSVSLCVRQRNREGVSSFLSLWIIKSHCSFQTDWGSLRQSVWEFTLRRKRFNRRACVLFNPKRKFSVLFLYQSSFDKLIQDPGPRWRGLA